MYWMCRDDITGISTRCSKLNFFFFKQKTAYEMRISDWSSDVCSSDLAFDDLDVARAELEALGEQAAGQKKERARRESGTARGRSEEGRVGQECVSTC